MNIATPSTERVFPLSTGSFERSPLRAPRLSVNPWSVSGNVLGHRAFMRAWAARRAARAALAENAGLAAGGIGRDDDPSRCAV